MNVEPASFTSQGVTCAADLHRPQDASGPVPCVVMAHGFSATKEDTLPAYAERFAAAGLAVLRFDYRGFGDSDGSPRQVLDVKAQLDDYRAAIAHARALPDVDADRIVVWGSSFSGGHAITLAAEDHRIAAAIAQAPFTDGVATLRAVPPVTALKLTGHALRDAAGAIAGRRPHLIPATGAPGDVAAMTSPDAHAGFAAIVGTPSRWRNEVAARIMLTLPLYRPVAKAAKITCPILVTVAEEDTITPPKPALAVAARAPKGESARYPGGHFDVYVGAGFERSAGDMLAFLERCGLTSP